MSFAPTPSPAVGPLPPAIPVEGAIALRTLILIRWTAVVGQLATLVFVNRWMNFDLPMGPALATVGASAAINLAAIAHRRVRPRLQERDAALYLGFDTLQLTQLLFLTGGLQNPFAVMILAPLTVAATSLSRRIVAMLTALVLVCVTILAAWHLPLAWPDGSPVLPALYGLGVWVALTLSAAFIAAYVFSVAHEARRLSTALAATQAALAREQQMSALGALAAAAAHELGSPLGTIAVVASELAKEIPRDDPLAEDIALLQSQVARCRDILADLARKPEAEGGVPFDRLPVRALLEEAATPHRSPRVELEILAEGSGGVPEPVLARSPELLHGLGNLLHNAIEFARVRVRVLASWDRSSLTVTIRDDGPGFPQHLLGRIGEPFISTRAVRGAPPGDRDGATHMGLGIFIAQTLLARTGAEIEVANRLDGGAEVVIRWVAPILDANVNETEPS